MSNLAFARFPLINPVAFHHGLPTREQYQVEMEFRHTYPNFSNQWYSQDAGGMVARLRNFEIKIQGSIVLQTILELKLQNISPIFAPFVLSELEGAIFDKHKEDYPLWNLENFDGLKSHSKLLREGEGKGYNSSLSEYSLVEALDLLATKENRMGLINGVFATDPIMIPFFEAHPNCIDMDSRMLKQIRQALKRGMPAERFASLMPHGIPAFRGGFIPFWDSEAGRLFLSLYIGGNDFLRILFIGYPYELQVAIANDLRVQSRICDTNRLGGDKGVILLMFCFPHEIDLIDENPNPSIFKKLITRNMTPKLLEFLDAIDWNKIQLYNCLTAILAEPFEGVNVANVIFRNMLIHSKYRNLSYSDDDYKGALRQCVEIMRMENFRSDYSFFMRVGLLPKSAEIPDTENVEFENTLWSVAMNIWDPKVFLVSPWLMLHVIKLGNICKTSRLASIMIRGDPRTIAAFKVSSEEGNNLVAGLNFTLSKLLKDEINVPLEIDQEHYIGDFCLIYLGKALAVMDPLVFYPKVVRQLKIAEDINSYSMLMFIYIELIAKFDQNLTGEVKPFLRGLLLPKRVFTELKIIRECFKGWSEDINEWQSNVNQYYGRLNPYQIFLAAITKSIPSEDLVKLTFSFDFLTDMKLILNLLETKGISNFYQEQIDQIILNTHN